MARVRYHLPMSTPASVNFRLDGRVALITGASSGLGAALARGFATAGAAVALVARREEKLHALAEEIRRGGGSAAAFVCDVTDPAAIGATFDAVAAQLGVADIIVNNAGIAEPTLYLKTTDATLQRTFATNFEAAWHVGAEGAKRLVAAGKGGSIIQIASVLGMGVGVGYSAYAASKAALIQLTRSMALEFIRHRIRVNALAPGWFVTEMNEAYFATAAGQEYLQRIPPARAGQLHELVGPALLLASDAGSFVNGVCLPVDGGHHVALV
jgi:NAD(P)-dependent dehydrogenase (short-subunit alcohol dehydrogenase family)